MWYEALFGLFFVKTTIFSHYFLIDTGTLKRDILLERVILKNAISLFARSDNPYLLRVFILFLASILLMINDNRQGK